MTLTIRNTLRSLSALALTAAFLPGCDGEDYETLGLSAEQIDGMSEEELDELAALEDEDEFDLTAQTRPGDPLPAPAPSDFTGPHADAATDNGLADTIWNPRYTHPAGDAGLANSFWNPRYTHTAEDAGLADTIWNPRYTHATLAPIVPGVANPVHPTHDAPLANLDLAVEDPGCDTHGDDPDFSNG